MKKYNLSLNENEKKIVFNALNYYFESCNDVIISYNENKKFSKPSNFDKEEYKDALRIRKNITKILERII